ncbi:hypothetical protein [Cupriavidus sp. BIS7]|uniref:hypothetical protein n=1 Tax=Cupriavidus sp. BIS7 TaxID=1217718 RepID=UPI0002DDAA55|nr:hypothetical protein [Cupriavidus sp. BIS7]
MIKNCRKAIPAIAATGIALLIVGSGQTYAQISPDTGMHASTNQSDLCSADGLAATPAVCRASGDPTRSKYNLLYADDAPDTEDTPTSGEDAPADRQTGRTPKVAPHSGLRSGAADS